MTPLYLALFIGFILLLLGFSIGFAVARWMHRIEPQTVEATIDYSTHGQEPGEAVYWSDDGRLVFGDGSPVLRKG